MASEVKDQEANFAEFYSYVITDKESYNGTPCLKMKNLYTKITFPLAYIHNHSFVLAITSFKSKGHIFLNAKT